MRYTEISQGGKHNAEVYLDMDGVLADFFTEYAKLAGIESGNYRDIPPAKTDPTLNKMIGTNFFARLPKFSTADQLVAMVVKIFGHYNICSSPLRGDHENSEKQKKVWLAKHLNPQPLKVVITPRKEKYAVQPDGTPNVLIDDRGDNITKWEAAGGVGIKYQADEDGLDVIVRGLRRALDIIRGEREHDPQQLVSKDRSLPVATDKDSVAEALYTDVPNEDWLNGKIEYAKKKGRNSFGVPYLGSVTARPQEDYFRLPVNLLKHLPGMRDEQNNVRQDDLKAIVQIMKDTGKLPLMSNGKEYRPFINVAYNGEAWVNEGNHRIMAAAALGWDTLPVELRYFDGGERVKSGPLYPAKIGLGKPIDENWKKALATGALAAATALGTPALGAGLPDLVAVVTMKIDGNIVRKEINLGNEYAGPTEAAEAIDKFMTSKGIKNYSLDIKRVPAKKVDENFHDGKVKGKSRPGRVKRAGASCNGSVTSLRAKAKKYGGEKGKMYHWCANMKGGKK